MKFLKALGLAAVAAMALTAFTAASASATTLEVGGVAKNSSVTISASHTAGDSSVWTRTDGTHVNTCTASEVAGSTVSPFTGTKVTGGVTTLNWTNCSAGNPTVHQKGQFYFEPAPKTHTVEHGGGVKTEVFTEHTTNGNLFSENAEVTVPTTLGFTVNCKTGAGTKIGTLKGVAAGSATLHIKGVLNCGFLLPSAIFEGIYTVTSPSGFGVVT